MGEINLNLKSKVMEKSESIINLSKALITFHVKVDKVSKDSTNPFFKSKYASLSNILNAIHLPLIESGLTFSQLPTGDNGLTTILMHGESGEFIQSTYEMKPVKDDPQGRGSVITYQRRYALASVLGLNIDDDDDANSGSDVGNKEKKPEDNRPWLTEQLLTQALTRIKAGEKDVYNKTDKAFRMKKEYREQLKTQLNGQPA